MRVLQIILTFRNNESAMVKFRIANIDCKHFDNLTRSQIDLAYWFFFYYLSLLLQKKSNVYSYLSRHRRFPRFKDGRTLIHMFGLFVWMKILKGKNGFEELKLIRFGLMNFYVVTKNHLKTNDSHFMTFGFTTNECGIRKKSAICNNKTSAPICPKWAPSSPE